MPFAIQASRLLWLQSESNQGRTRGGRHRAPVRRACPHAPGEPVGEGLRVTVEYYAALLFFLAVSVTQNGAWGERQDRMLVPHDDWLRRSVKETARAYGLAILCAWLLGTIGRSLGDIVEAIPYVIVWGGLGLLILAGVLNEIEKAERRDRRRRSRRSRSLSNYLTAVIHTKARYAGRCASCGIPSGRGCALAGVPGLGWCCSRCVL